MATDSLMQTAADNIAKANQVEPLTNDYDESKSTASRVADITRADSSLMQLAATSGTQAAASRGLTNTSLAIGSAQDAVLKAATPIAQTDANLSSQQSLANLAAKNQAALANAGNAVDLGKTGLALDNSNQQQKDQLAQQDKQFNVQAGQAQQQIDAQIDQFAKSLGMTAQDLQIKRDTLTQQQQQFLANLEGQKSIAQLQSDTQKVVAGLSSSTQIEVAKIENQFKSDIAGDQNITNAWGTMMSTISSIQNNANLDYNTKTTLINNQLETFKAYADYHKSLTGVDVSALLNFGGSSTGSRPGAPAPGGYQPVPAPTPSAPPYVVPYGTPGQPGFVDPNQPIYGST